MTDDAGWADPRGAQLPPGPAGPPLPAAPVPPPDPYARVVPVAAEGAPPQPWAPQQWAPAPVYPPPPSSLTARAWVAAGWLVITAVIDLLSIGHHMKLGPLMDEVEAGVADADLQARLSGWDDASVVFALASTVAFLATGIAFIVWLWGARTNTESYGWTAQRRAKGWVIGSWFVPVVSLWFPFQVVADVWKASHPARPADRRDINGLLTGPLLRWWWAFYLLSNIITFAVYRVEGETVAELRSLAGWRIFADGLDLVGVVLAILVIRQISRFQAFRAAAQVPWIVDQATLPKLPRLSRY